ncbi:hypothetical protein PFFCH_03054 [Plasmodium falciparum FCH/4]|uniref:Uncharacterized protein n=4 Tax=Plasmodium falciparum TaxID=5833 RepID=A0A024VMH4_PLAFA|nr:hypothetical protein PFFVO_04127 [Plasmodium falciparum Vietnam Oak-Knoll (FVO)]ETW29483.1 hypothetical protein PFFCH_03054 [Plasmodium falciparum FCH/4]ETW41054.1 hypothetical protein PFNF135_04688 [Plasmodium falciparum NF135/5.C10]
MQNSVNKKIRMKLNGIDKRSSINIITNDIASQLNKKTISNNNNNNNNIKINISNNDNIHKITNDNKNDVQTSNVRKRHSVDTIYNLKNLSKNIKINIGSCSNNHKTLTINNMNSVEKNNIEKNVNNDNIMKDNNYVNNIKDNNIYDNNYEKNEKNIKEIDNHQKTDSVVKSDISLKNDLNRKSNTSQKSDISISSEINKSGSTSRININSMNNVTHTNRKSTSDLLNDLTNKNNTNYIHNNNNNSSSSVMNGDKNNYNFIQRNKEVLKNNLKIFFKNENIPFSFLYHKVLTILKSHYNNHVSNNPTTANKGISFYHMENMLINLGFKGVDINNHLLLSYLASSKQIKVDMNEKRLCYMNPYIDITNMNALLNKINKQGFLYGYEINDDLINTNKEVYKWINVLLYEKKVRCIRTNNSHLRGKLKCKNIPNVCDIYAKTKCDNCFYNLKGYLFFPLSYEHIEKERYSITNDMKMLWDEISLPSLDNILKEYKLKSTNNVFMNENLPKKKNKDDKLSPILKKMKRIYNTHLFTADEIKNEFIHKK